MTEPSLPEKVVAIHGGLHDGKVPHAFGGALALAYYAEPRATIDVDVNVFVSPSESQRVWEALAPLGVDTAADVAALERDGQCRLSWGRTPIDVFFAYDEIHAEMRRATRSVPFGDDRIPVLGPEHLVICKAVFARPKDWLDIEQVLVSNEDLDVDLIASGLERVVGPDDPRAERFAGLADAARY